MALRPGINTSIRETELIRPAPTDTGPAFLIGMFEKGPVGETITLASDAQATEILGGVVPYSSARDAIAAMFAEGAGTINVSRIVGPAAAKASVALPNASNVTTATATASEFGAAANGRKITVADGDNSDVILTVKTSANVVLETSPALATETAFLAWGETSKYIDLTDAVATGLPKAGTYTLVGGDGDEDGAGNTEVSAALDVFGYEQGPGQVLAPGYSTSAVTALLAEHAESHNRYALADAPDVDVDALVAYADTVRGLIGDNARFVSIWAPSVLAKPTVLGANRQVPFSAVQAGMIARSDRTNSVGTAVANVNGKSLVATDVTRSFTGDEITRLVAAGISVAINRRGTVISYSDRTVADVASDANWYEASDTRTIMALRAEGEAFLETLEFVNLDGRGKIEARAYNGLRDLLAPHYDADDLFGPTFEDSFSISVAADPTTRSVSADEAVTLSQGAEVINFTITKRQAEEIG